MIRLLIVGVTVAVAVAAGWFSRRRPKDAPMQAGVLHPTQLDRADFGDDREWLVVAFTAESCSTCADIESKVRVLESAHVGVHTVEYSANRDLHTKYDIDAVPCLVFADVEGVVRAGFVGPVSATDIWAASARLRDGVTVENCADREDR